MAKTTASTSSSASWEGSGDFELIEGDIRDLEHLTEISRGMDQIVHFAAKAGVRPSLADPLAYVDVNVRGTVNVLEAARRADVPRVVLASSSSVYGNHPELPFRESASLNRPISPYAATKLAGEQMGHTYHHLYGLTVIVLRFFTVYGPRQRPEMAIHKFVRSIETGREITLHGRGSRRDYTYVDDIVSGVVAACHSDERYAIFNLGNSTMIELDELIEAIQEALGKPARIQRIAAQPGDVECTCADLSESRARLGYRPRVDLAEGLRRFVEWYARSG